MTRVLPLFLLAALALTACDDGTTPSESGSASGPSADSTAADSSATNGTRPSGDPSGPSSSESPPADKGVFQSALDVLLAHPRKEKRQNRTSTCSPDQDYSGRSLPYHSIEIDNGNGFNTTHEAFETSSPDAQTPYVAYATWDPCTLALGLTGSAVGAGDCAGGDCAVVDQAESAYRYWVVYLDTDPQGAAGTLWPRELGPVPERLPFRADYLLEVRLDGVTQQVGDGMSYQGNAQLYTRTSDWRVGLEESWQSAGRDGLRIGDNSSSNFIELTIDREALGDPCAIQAVGWVVDTQADTLFAHWPPPRGMRFGGRSPQTGSPDDASAAADRAPGSRSGRRDTSAMRSPRGAAQGRSASARRPTPADSLVLDVYGFMLTDGQTPNANGNLNRTDFSLVQDGCTTPDRPTE